MKSDNGFWVQSKNLFPLAQIKKSSLVLGRGPTSVAVGSAVVGIPAKIGLVQVLQIWLCFTFHSDGPNCV